MILIDYIGKTKNGEVFDLSSEEKAKEEGIYQEGMDFDPIPVLFGEDYIIEGLEEELRKMSVGDEKEIEVPAEKAYGKRESDKIQTYPEKEFTKQDVNIRVGDTIQIGQRRGKIISHGSGRVRVDFNHPLSGQDLTYNVEILEKLEDSEERAEQIFKYRMGHGEIEVEDKTATISHSADDHGHQIPEEIKERLTEEIKEHTDIENVEFKE